MSIFCSYMKIINKIDICTTLIVIVLHLCPDFPIVPCLTPGVAEQTFLTLL